MAIANKYYFSGNKPFVGYDGEVVSGLEITCAENPSDLGLFYDKLRQKGNDLMDIFARAKESTHDGKYITWDEEVKGYQTFNAPGLITRAASSNDFVINNSAVEAVLVDFNICNDSDSIFYDIEPGTEVKVIDSTGEEQHGYVTDVSEDRLTATIMPSTGGEDWTVGETGLTILPLGREVPTPDDCGSCFRNTYDPATYMNNFVELDTCLEVDEREFLERGSIYRPSTTNGYYRYRQEADMEVEKLFNDAYHKMMFGRKVQSDSAIAGGSPKWKGLSGVIEQIEERGSVNQGEIESKEDLQDIAVMLDYLKAPNKHFIDAAISQYQKLEGLPWTDANLNLSYEPYGCCQDDILKYGIKGFSIGGHEFYFRKWGISQYSDIGADHFGAKYHYMMQPYNYNKVVFNDGSTYNQSYLHVVWGGNKNKNMKLVRVSDMGSSTCLSYKVRYITRFTVALTMAHHWMIGKS